MSAISTWSETAASNNSAAPNGAPEGMSPSGVNDTIRECMAAIRVWYDSGGWNPWGHTTTYASGTSFTVATDVTTIYSASRRVKAVGAVTGTIYGTITSSTYGAPNTTVNVTWDSGALVNEALTISLAFLEANGTNGVTAGAQTWTGVKTFASIPIGPASDPTTDNQLTRKAYVIPLAQKAAASGVASLNASTKVVEDPANATATPTASKIPIAGSGGKLYGWIDSYVQLQDQKVANTAGGDFTSGAWRTRTLNTEVKDADAVCSLAANQFTLLAGTYRIQARAAASSCNGHKLRLYNITDAAVVANLLGESGYAGAANNNYAQLNGEFVIAGTKAFELQHRCSLTQNYSGMGVATNIGEIEVYSDVQLWKVA